MEKYYCSILVSPMGAENSEKSEMVSQILYGETCEIIKTEGNFSKIKMDFDESEGWVNSSVLKKQHPDITKNIVTQTFGVFDLPEGKSLLSIGSEVEFAVENFVDKENIRESIAETAKQFLNIPYLWGGRSFFGVDAGGFVQLLYKVHGIHLPRTAERQAEFGEVLDFLGESDAGDLAFFGDEAGNISHIGVMLNNYEVIHANGKVRIDSLDSSGIYNNELKKHTYKLRFVKRILD